MSENITLDPQYVQVSKQRFAEILGCSTAHLDRLRERDPKCPEGHKATVNQFSRVMFRLSECYEYSEYLMKIAVKAETHLKAETA